MSKGLRRFLMVFTLLFMVTATAFLCVFLLFKVRTIEVTGDAVYDQATVLQMSGLEIGDNLALLSVGEHEKALEQKLPYAEDVQMIRHFPSSLEIHITGAKEVACISSGSQWFSVSASGKILEERTGPSENAMQVTGLLLTEPVVGGQAKAQDEEHQQAFEDILTTLANLEGTGDFTSLDLTDLYNITMNYQGRILFQLGSTVELDYKVDYGYRLVTQKMESDATGILDLSLAGDVRRAYFTASSSPTDSTGTTSSTSGSDENDSSQDASDGSSASDSGDGDSSNGGDAGDDTSSQEDGSAAEDTSSQADRGGDIPDTIFTG